MVGQVLWGKGPAMSTTGGLPGWHPRVSHPVGVLGRAGVLSRVYVPYMCALHVRTTRAHASDPTLRPFGSIYIKDTSFGRPVRGNTPPQYIFVVHMSQARHASGVLHQDAHRIT